MAQTTKGAACRPVSPSALAFLEVNRIVEMLAKALKKGARLAMAMTLASETNVEMALASHAMCQWMSA